MNLDRVPALSGQMEAVDTKANTSRLIALARCMETFQMYLHLPDPSAVLVTLATIAANRAPGDALWTLLVGPPAGGKTEVIASVASQPDVFLASTMTEAALLSGTPGRERSATATGGLLRQIGQGPATLLCKDFGSVLSMNREARAQVLAALREVYDGQWTRYLGTDGGKTLFWEGKVGLLGGVTPAVDSHHAVLAALGERFLWFRLPEVDSDAQASRALEHLGHEHQMRDELARVAGAVLDAVDDGALTARPAKELSNQLVALATLAVRARSAVERDTYSREVTLIPESEAPARFTLSLLRLWNGLRAIGVDEAPALDVVAKAALDSMPQVRRQVLDTLMAGGRMSTTDIAEAIGYPTTTTRRACEDLFGHGIVVRGKGGEGKADQWWPSDFTVERYPTLPEKSEGESSLFSFCTHLKDFSGKVPGAPPAAPAALDAKNDAYLPEKPLTRDVPDVSDEQWSALGHRVVALPDDSPALAILTDRGLLDREGPTAEDYAEAVSILEAEQ